jgi:hypothetical protein
MTVRKVQGMEDPPSATIKHRMRIVGVRQTPKDESESVKDWRISGLADAPRYGDEKKSGVEWSGVLGQPGQRAVASTLFLLTHHCSINTSTTTAFLGPTNTSQEFRTGTHLKKWVPPLEILFLSAHHFYDPL